MIGEIMIGIVIGLITKIIFAGIQFAGEMIGIQIGFSIVNVIDPVSSTQVSVIAEFQYLIALLVYLAVDAHHTLIFAIVDSYRIVSPFSLSFLRITNETHSYTFKGIVRHGDKNQRTDHGCFAFHERGTGRRGQNRPSNQCLHRGLPCADCGGIDCFWIDGTLISSMLVQRALSNLNIEVYTLLRFM